MTMAKEKSTTNRGHNEGSIYQRASDGLWVAALTLPSGKRKAYYGKTRPEAKAKLKAAQHDLDAGLDLDAAKTTVGQFLDRWLEDTAKPTVRPSTYESYRLHVERHLKSGIGHLPLAKLTPQHVQKLLNDKAKAGLSARTVQLTRATLRRALGYAVKWSLVSRNVATLVDPPRTVRTPVQPLTVDQVRRFLDATKDDRLGPLFHVAIASGLRQGELLGLRWEDVDLVAGTVTVRRALQRIDKRPVFVEPKTERSRRTVNLPASAVAAMKVQKDRQAFARQAAGVHWEEQGLVFASTIGTPLDAPNVTHRLQALLKQAELPRQRFHDLRHCCASLMLANGEHPRVVMETLGHSQISLTMNTYSHVMPAMQRDAADRLDALLTASS
jgi:integrase